MSSLKTNTHYRRFYRLVLDHACDRSDPDIAIRLEAKCCITESNSNIIETSSQQHVYTVCTVGGLILVLLIKYLFAVARLRVYGRAFVFTRVSIVGPIGKEDLFIFILSCFVDQILVCGCEVAGVRACVRVYTSLNSRPYWQRGSLHIYIISLCLTLFTYLHV